MYLGRKGISRIYLAAMFISWLCLAFFSYSNIIEQNTTIHAILKDIFQGAYILSVFLYFKLRVGTIVGVNFPQLLWRGFIYGIMLVVLLFLINMTMTVIDPYKQLYSIKKPDKLFINIYYFLNVTVITLYLAKVFYIFKRLIMYQKSKNLSRIWILFEYTVLGSVIFIPLNVTFFSEVYIIIIGLVSFFVLALSLNMKWIAYLNLKQKLKSLGLLSVVLLISLGFILYVYEQDFMYKYKNQLGANEHYLLLNMGGKIIYLLSFSFILIYAGSCVLVLLFNLPTSSVFEQKFGEVLNFQRLSHSVKMGINESQIYDLLLEGSMNTVLADAAWLDIYDSDGDHEIIQSLRQNINTKESQELRSLIRENQPRIRGDIVLIKNLRKLGTDEGDAIYKYKSLLGIPLQTYNKNIGTLYLVKKIKDGFDKELLEVLATFVGQASMSLENNRLISEAIENERYKEELKIATSVQQSLLPQDLISSPYFEIGALSIPATEVGGDYYDVFELTSEQVAIVIGDVSGHGTKAAFHMAQLKGVFQSLISLKLTPSEFMIHANQALGRCLEKNIFVTLSLFIIDLKDKTINYSRAGHCPTLFFSKETLKTEYLESEGLGLGILRNDSYNKHAKAYTFEYKPGDIMVLYTDGIVEAKNKNGQEFDFHRLRSIVKKENALGADDLVSKINNELIKFCDTEEMDDDRTMVVIKFHS